MRKILASLFIILIVALAACGGSDNNNENNENGNNNNGNNENAAEEQTLKVAAVESPMTDVVEIAKDLLADEGIEVEVVEMGDYIQPNEALKNEEVDATFSQHVPFMEQFNENADGNLRSEERRVGKECRARWSRM